MTATVSVFRGSPRPCGNTNALTYIAVSTFRETGLEVREFDLYRMNIRPASPAGSVSRTGLQSPAPSRMISLRLLQK